MNQRSIPATDVWRQQRPMNPERAGLPPVDWPNQQHSRIVSAGARWHVQRAGKGPAILLLHGTGSSTHTWDQVFKTLAEANDVLAVDLPGHGFSSALPSGRTRLDGISTALAGLLQAVDFKPDVIVGHSAGAAIALQLVLHDLTSPAAVVGINAALQPFGGTLAALFAPLARSMTLVPFLPKLIARRARNIDVIDRMLRSTGSDLPEQNVTRYQQLLIREQHVAATLQMMADWDLRTLLDDIEPLAAQTYLMVADGDEAVPPQQTTAVKKRYPDVTVKTMSGVGHLANEERPDLTAAYVAAVLRQERSGGR